jgi:hypothetical protein
VWHLTGTMPGPALFGGHLVNFLVLIRDVLSYAERQSLDFAAVFETLETMVSTFSITQPTASASAWSRFEEVHADVREYLYGSNRLGSREGSDNVSMMPDSHGIDSIGSSSSAFTLRIPNESPHELRTRV